MLLLGSLAGLSAPLPTKGNRSSRASQVDVIGHGILSRGSKVHWSRQLSEPRASNTSGTRLTVRRVSCRLILVVILDTCTTEVGTDRCRVFHLPSSMQQGTVLSSRISTVQIWRSTLLLSFSSPQEFVQVLASLRLATISISPGRA